ncbi:fungal-specific transcription factor domain-containing protein [Penicillium angulare]|uniref:fungal-specific transcription factor domain-containing protein n=1 Tax=Penicillium angulare TaxID=116970 RepID=UPI00254203BB|nr:fungal-specific transcription factor domain-containing protein [Penicillium angulare]KAJ5263647.1 fungal-specific transcription factor domain-containing protein [Penicillium angulare]
MLLLCIYVLLCPNVTNIWRLLGHATRMGLDVIEVHGSGKANFANTASPIYPEEEQNQTNSSLRYYGELQQGETLLLAKLTADHQDPPLDSLQESSVGRQILRAACGLYQISNSPVKASLACVPRSVFPMTWTCAHGIFNSMDVVLQDSSEDSATYEEVSVWMQKSVEMLKFVDDGMQLRTAWLVGYLQTIFRSKYSTA